MKKIFWFSDENLSEGEIAKLNAIYSEGVEIIWSKTISSNDSVTDLDPFIDDADIIAFPSTLPLEQQQLFFKHVDRNKPVIRSRRDVYRHQPINGESAVFYRFVKWELLNSITIDIDVSDLW